MGLEIGKIQESVLISAAKAGDADAMETLVHRYSRLVKSVAHVYTLRGADVEDMMQEGMLGLLSAVQRYDADRGVSFPAFARVCISRRMQSVLRASAAHKNDPLNHALSLDKPQLEDLETDLYAAQPSDPESLLIGMEEHQEHLARLFDLLSHFEAQVLRLYVNGLSYDEIARTTGKSVKSIDNAMQRIRRKTGKL